MEKNHRKNIEERIATVRKLIHESALKIGKTADQIRLIAVSKQQPIERIEAALKAGIKYLGENHAQEMLKKWEALGSRMTAVDWIFIGHLQTNKVKSIVDKIAEIQTLDSVKLFKKLHEEAKTKKRRISVLIQINIGEEATKSGILPQNLIPFLKEIMALNSHLDIQGLMAIPPYFDDAEKSRPYFRKMRELLIETKDLFPTLNLKELSMGMSHDFQIAIEEGATQVRIGEAIFGKRISHI